MRTLLLSAVIAASLATPATAAWQDYTYPELNFYVTFPNPPKEDAAEYVAPDGSTLKGKLYSLEEGGNIFRVVVVDFSGNTLTKTAIIKQAVDRFRAEGEVAEDIYARISNDFGRNLHILMKDGSVKYLSIYFANNRKLYIIEGIKSPGVKNAYALRFKESISFIAPPRPGGAGRGAGRGGAGRGGAAPSESAGRGAANP